MENYLITSPLKVCIYDPVAGKTKRIFCFVGDIPKNIFSAIIAASHDSESAAQTKLLKEFYGADWKVKLAIGEARSGSNEVINDSDYEYIDGGSDTTDNTNSISVRGHIYSDDTSQDNKIITHEIINGADYEDVDDINDDINDNINDSIIDEIVDALDVEGGDDIGNDIIGGDSNDGDIDFSDIEELLNAPKDTGVKDTSSAVVSKPRHAPQRVRRAVTETQAHIFERGVEYVRDVHIYPEDNFMELKDKIFLATGVPAYRQHLFYYDKNRINITYKLYAEGIYNVDIRALKADQGIPITTIAGLPVDKFLYDVRESLRIEALDTFNILSNSLTASTVYVVDLDQFIRSRAQIGELINDTYQFELIYYGFVVKYWPQLTQECFHDYINNEEELQYKFPDLAKSRSHLTVLHNAEKAIVDYNYRVVEKSLAWAENDRHRPTSIAITQMTATVASSRAAVNIRNLFDKLRVTRCMPEIHAYIEHNGKRLLLRKRHIKNESDIPFPSGNIMKRGITIAISLRKVDQDTFHARESKTTMENEQSRYMFLNILPSGQFFIRSVWNEEDEYGFDDLIRIIKQFTDPIINGINNLGKYVLPNGDRLPTVTKYNISYHSLNICVFWKKVLLESSFKILKTLWEPYLKANITGTRNVQQFGIYEFFFRKGVYDYDATSIERIISASNNILLNNYYLYLTNAAIKQKWDQSYSGRIVRMSHRTTDVKFEILNIREKEFRLFYNYIVVFITKAMCDERIKNISNITATSKETKALKKLREQDPNLFNLKKYGSKKLYSTLCQNKKQPAVYTDEEVRAMSKDELSKLTKYWNFTLNREAWYGCPNRAFPHLYFTADKHPKHYCMPCCKKIESSEESKKSRITQMCLQNHKYNVAADSELSRHITNYGKEIDVGRLSKLPNADMKALMFNTLKQTGPTRLDYYLFGVPQHFPGAKNVGVLYCIAESLKMEVGDLMRKLVQDLNKIIRSDPSGSASFNLLSMLLNGTLVEYFRSVQDLADTIKDLFVDLKHFSSNHAIAGFNQWQELFIELFYIVEHIAVFTFIDEGGRGDTVDLYVPNYMISEIMYLHDSQSRAKNTAGGRDNNGDSTRGDSVARDDNKVARDRHLYNDAVDAAASGIKYIVVVKKVNHYYPIFVVDADRYFKTFDIESRWYNYSDDVIKLLFTMVVQENRSRRSEYFMKPNLELLSKFADGRQYKIVEKFINKRNLCYGVMLESQKSHALIYVPVDYSTNVTDRVPVRFTSVDRHKDNLSAEACLEFISDFNKFIVNNYAVSSSSAAKVLEGELGAEPTSSPQQPHGRTPAVYRYNPIVLDSLVVMNGQLIGFKTHDGFYYYFDDVAVDSPDYKQIADRLNVLMIPFRSSNGDSSKYVLPIKHLQYDYSVVNNVILNRLGAVADNRVKMLGRSLYSNYIYQLFVIEFINYLEKERNHEIRSQLKKLITDTDFKKGFAEFRRNVAALLKDFPADYGILQSQLSNFYYVHFNKNTLVDQIDNTVYEFDHVTINRLRAMPRDQLKAELTKIAATFSVQRPLPGGPDDPISFPNIYLPCSSVPVGGSAPPSYCADKKLIVDRDLNDIIDILASDIHDDIRVRYLIDSLFTENTVDYLRFDQLPTEVITILILSE